MHSDISRRSVLFLAIIVSFFVHFMSSSIIIALPTIGREFSMNAVSLSWIATAYILSTAIFLVPFGKIADMYGRKKIFTYGIIVYTISSLFLAMSPSPGMLISFRVLQGIGASMISGTVTALLVSTFPIGERGKAIGIHAGSIYVALSLGPFLGGILTQYFGWRSIFFITAMLGFAVVIAVFWKLKAEWTDGNRGTFDLRGSLIYGIAITAIIYGLSQLQNGWGIVSILTGIGGIITFIWWENRVSSPVLHMSLYKKNRTFAFATLAAMINTGAAFAVTFLASLYLQYIRGLSPQNAGLILISIPVIQSFLSPIAGRLSDSMRPDLLASIGMGVTTVGLFLFAFLGQTNEIESILFTLIILGCGFAFFSSPNTNAAMNSVESKSYGVASATLAAMRQLGVTLSMGVIMSIFATQSGTMEIAPEFYPVFMRSFRLIFILFAALCFSSACISLASGRVKTT